MLDLAHFLLRSHSSLFLLLDLVDHVHQEFHLDHVVFCAVDKLLLYLDQSLFPLFLVFQLFLVVDFLELFNETLAFHGRLLTLHEIENRLFEHCVQLSIEEVWVFLFCYRETLLGDVHLIGNSSIDHEEHPK